MTDDLKCPFCEEKTSKDRCINDSCKLFMIRIIRYRAEKLRDYQSEIKQKERNRILDALDSLLEELSEKDADEWMYKKIVSEKLESLREEK